MYIKTSLGRGFLVYLVYSLCLGVGDLDVEYGFWIMVRIIPVAIFTARAGETDVEHIEHFGQTACAYRKFLTLGRVVWNIDELTEAFIVTNGFLVGFSFEQPSHGGIK